MKNEYCQYCGQIFEDEIDMHIHKRFCNKSLKNASCYNCKINVKVNNILTTKNIFCEDCLNKLYTHTCCKCKKTFRKIVKISKKNRRRRCNDCKRTVKHHQDLNNISKILDLSSRTVRKILNRHDTHCCICNWNKASCDIHHILSVKRGGTNSDDNLIVVCPNCHRITHQTTKYSTTFLKERSIARIFPQWREFYNKKINEKTIKKEKKQRLQIKIRREKEQNIHNLINKILNSNINFGKFGWVKLVAKLLNIQPQKVNKWMTKYMFKFYIQKCFKRK